ncbi:MAG: hypothetical protein AAF596_08870, partial [Planctomycetota bacterium]
YAAWLHSGDEYRSMLETNAWKKLATIPGIQLGWMQLQAQWQFPSDPRVQMAKAWVDSPDGQEVLALLGELGQDEVFVYGGGGFTELLELAVEANALQSSMQMQQLIDQFESDDEADGEADADDVSEGQPGYEFEMVQQEIVAMLDEYGDDLAVPELVIGFRVGDRERAVGLLDRYEAPLRDVLAAAPLPVANRLKRVSDDGAELLTVDVAGDMLPWDQIELEWEASPELLEAIRESLEEKRAVLSVGVVGEFVVVSLAGSNDHLTDTVDDPLLEREEFERLGGHAGERLRTISYASGDFLRAANSTRSDMQQLAELGKGVLAAVEIDDDRRDEIGDDIDALTDEVLKYVPESGAVAGVTFATDRGYEGYTYNWGDVGPALDGTQPLTLIDHVGADSIGWAVRRGKYSADEFGELMTLGGRVLGDVETLVEPQLEPDEWQQYLDARGRVLPLVRRLAEATRDHLLPGLADGQSALVLEATATDPEWNTFLPPPRVELPMPSLAVVFGVSDPEAVKAAGRAYLAVIADAVGMAGELAADQGIDGVPAVELPSPSARSIEGGDVYTYELPPETGVNERFAFNAALSDEALVLGLLPEVSETLLAGSRPGLDGRVADFSRPLLSAGHISFAKLLDAFRPWIDYGVKLGVAKAQEDAGGEAAQAAAMVGFVKPQVDQLLDVLRVWDSYTGVTYREDDAWVTHGETRFIDLED